MTHSLVPGSPNGLKAASPPAQASSAGNQPAPNLPYVYSRILYFYTLACSVSWANWLP
jgi:hypothetical protein